MSKKAEKDARRRLAICWHLLAIGLILLAWVLRLDRLSAQSFWYDEGYSVLIAALPAAKALEWSAADLIPPLYRYSLTLWLPLAGRSEFAARFLSVGAGTLLVATVVRLGATLHSQQAGLLAGLLAALSPFYVWHSQDARMYMPEALFGTLATLFLVRALCRPGQHRLWVGFAFLDVLALYTHMTAVFLVGFHSLLILLLGLRSRRVWTHGGPALGCILLAWIPWLAYALPGWGENMGYWPGHLNWQFITSRAFQGFVTGQVLDGIETRVALWIWIAACLMGLTALALSASRGHQVLAFLLFYFGVPVTAMAWLFRDIPKFSPRHLIGASPALFLLVSVGPVARMRGRQWYDRLYQGATGILLIGVVATAGLGLRNLHSDPASAKSDFRTAARLVRQEMQPNEIVLIVPGHTFPVWQYYFGDTGWVALPDDPLLDVTHTLHYRNTVTQLNRALAGRSGAWLVEWEPWQIDPTSLVEQLLTQVGEDMPLPEQPGGGVRLFHFRLHADRLPLPSEPAVTPPVHTRFDLPLGLDGCVLPRSVPGDEALRVACYWRAFDVLPEHLSVSARIVDTTGTEWGRADMAITGPYLVAGRWPFDEPVLGRYTVQQAPGIPPGDFYQLRLLIYEPDGTLHGDAVLAPLTIARPSRPFTATSSAGQRMTASLGGLVLEEANVEPQHVLPGEEVTVQAIWRVDGPFDEPHLAVEGQPDTYPLLPRPGATRLWRPGDRYRTFSRVPISPHTPGGETVLWAVSADRQVQMGAVTVDITRTFVLPFGIPPLDYRLGDALSLIGAQWTRSGTVADIVLYWRANMSITQTYTVFVQLIGPDGAAHAQADSWPQSGRHPTDHWLPGEIVPDAYQLSLSADAPPGTYRIIAGMYDLATLERLPVTDAEGHLVPDNAILLGEFTLP